MSRRAYGLADVRRTIRCKSRNLACYPNVVRICIGQEIRGGRRQSRLAIRFIVKRKFARSRLARAEIIPSRVRGVARRGRPANFFIPTDVEEGPERLSLLNVEGGTSLWAVRGGRAALAYGTKGNVAGVLTAAHVVCRLGSRGIGNTVYAEGYRSEGAGYVSRATLIVTKRANRMDAAFVRLYEDVAANWDAVHGQPEPVVRCGAVAVDSPHQFFYIGRRKRLKVCEQPNSLESRASYMELGGQDVPFEGFVVLTLTNGARAERGDSGSLLVRREPGGLVACGLVFAGAGRSVAVYPIRRVFTALEAGHASDAGDHEDVAFWFC